MPCCHIPNPAQPAFPATLVPDAQRFSQYVGNGNPSGRAATTTILTSGLHLEMKLWPPTGQLPTPPHKINDAQHNSWQAMSGRTTAPTGQFPRFLPQEKEKVFTSIEIPARPKACALLEYDRWLLEITFDLRRVGLAHAGIAVAWVPSGKTSKPPELATVGLSQKLLNIFIKYELSWQVTGVWRSAAFAHYSDLQLPELRYFLCALHAPLDSIVLKGIANSRLGKWLQERGLQKPNGDLLKSCTGSFRPWSKLDCLRTYYGLQLMLRRIAMETWPKGCACSASPDQAIKDCADWFNQKYVVSNNCKGHDWIQAACDLPIRIVEETLAEVRNGSGNEADGFTPDAKPAKKAYKPDADTKPVNESQSSPENGKKPESAHTVSGHDDMAKPEKFEGGTSSGVSKMPAVKREIYLQDTPKGSFTKIVNACGDRRNIGLITKTGELWLIADRRPKQRYLISEIKAAGGPDLPNKPRFIKSKGGATSVGGSGFQGGVSLGSHDNCRQFLSLWFIVRDCP